MAMAVSIKCDEEALKLIWMMPLQLRIHKSSLRHMRYISELLVIEIIFYNEIAGKERRKNKI